MLVKIILTLIVLIGLFLVVASFQPNDFKISRSILVMAPADKIFAQINDLKAFDKWNPFMEADPQVKVAYDGPVSGIGMSSTWSGNNQIGAGKNTIVESRPGELVGMQLDFERPMKNKANVQFNIQPQSQGTLVTWNMTGDCNFAAKVIHMIINMDRMVGGSFEKGLANLKIEVEKK